jgi:AraC-like DNA-binding protein
MTPTGMHRLPEEQWRVALGTNFGNLAPEPLDTDAADGWIDGLYLGQLATFQGGGSPQVVRRTRAAIRAVPAEMYKICVQISGRATVHQDRREIVVNPGQMAIYDTGRPYAVRFEREWSCAVLAFPRSALRLPEKIMNTSLTRSFDLTDGPGAVLVDFVRSAVRQHASLRDATATRLGEAGLHLIAGTLSDTTPADDAADALRLQVLGYVRAHLDDLDLSHASVAAAHHMAARTLHRLFEGEPLTVTDYIREQRLAAVRRDLADPLLHNRSIAAIAARWGFTDQAHFTRAFRARYAETPSYVRRTACVRPFGAIH